MQELFNKFFYNYQIHCISTNGKIHEEERDPRCSVSVNMHASKFIAGQRANRDCRAGTGFEGPRRTL